MSETKIPPIPEGIDPELAARISGGESLMCTADELQKMLDGLQQNYNTLIDFTSYVIERVAGNP